MAKTRQTTYASDGGAVFKIRIGEDLYTALTTKSGGTVTQNSYVKISKTNREFGLRPRLAVLSRTAGTAPDQFVKYKRIPALTADDFAGQLAIGQTITIGGTAWTVVDNLQEDK